MKEIIHLIKKEMLLEWRNKFALNGIILYLISTIFICYMSFKLKVNSLEPITWNTLFWIIMLFTAVNSIAKSFAQENKNRNLYYYTLISPKAYILAKIIYNVLLLMCMGIIALVVYSIFMDNPVINTGMYLISVLFGAFGFAASLTLISGIASKADNATNLMAVLSFPVILPMLVMLIKFSKNAMDGLTWSANYDEIFTLLGIDIIVIALSYLLFPYLWKT